MLPDMPVGYTGETSRRGTNAKLKGIELFHILAVFPHGGCFSKLKLKKERFEQTG